MSDDAIAKRDHALRVTRESLRKALAMLEREVPDHNFKCGFCASWEDGALYTAAISRAAECTAEALLWLREATAPYAERETDFDFWALREDPSL